MNHKEIFEDITGKRARSIEKQGFGVSDDVVLINGGYIVREALADIDPYNAASIEAKVLQQISNLKISEKVIFYNPQTGTKISNLISNSFHYQEAMTHEQLFLLAKTIKKLHKSPITDTTIPEYKMLERMEFYKGGTPDNLKLNSSEEQQAFKAIQKWMSSDNYVLCHNDITEHNILFTFSKCFLIDWKHAMMNHPYSDLASVIGENIFLTKNDVIFFLKSYFGGKYSESKFKKSCKSPNFAVMNGTIGRCICTVERNKIRF